MDEQQKIIDANDRSIRQVLDKVKYHIDVFQREYKWQRKQMEQLIDDLTMKFYANYDTIHERKDVAKYGKYYLGSIVLCSKDEKRSIIDGQQRLTSITLLLIYLNNLQRNNKESVQIESLIFSEKYSIKSFNLEVDDRRECIESLYHTGTFNINNDNESVLNIVERYDDIEELFPEDLKKQALPFFIDWLIDSVIFVEIITYSDDDAYTIFETMNDRGLNLTSAEMLKGYLLSNLESQEDKRQLNDLWKANMLSLTKIDKDGDLEFFKVWLRAKYADTIRQGKKGSENEDFEKIGTRFHSWVRDNKEKIGLKTSRDFKNLLEKELPFYIDVYLKIWKTGDDFSKDFENVFYLEKNKFPKTFYAPLMLASIKLGDGEKTINAKIKATSKFIERFIVFRSVNYRTLGYNAIRYTMYNLVKEIRNKEVNELVGILKERVTQFEEKLEGISKLRLHNQNKRFIHFLLARITRYIEEESGIESKFKDYVDSTIRKPFQIEHLWADKFEYYKNEFEQENEWDEYRNSLGSLVLLPEGINQSYNDTRYEGKLEYYYGQNLLAKSLNPKCYQRNPSFIKFIQKESLPFKPHEHFDKKDVEERQKLFELICGKIYDISEFDKIVECLI